MPGGGQRARPSLRCRLGWHAPRKGALWNEGYYFTVCERCGLDLVRTTFSGWEAPRGFRVVWRAGPPEPRPAPTTQFPPPRAAPLASAEAPAPPPARPRTITRHRSAIPDFMDDPGGSPPAPPTGGELRPPGGNRARR